LPFCSMVYSCSKPNSGASFFTCAWRRTCAGACAGAGAGVCACAWVWMGVGGW
jgi:hypothetical protein